MEIIMDVTLITAAYTGLKFAKDALQTALSYKIENETRAQISAALEKLGSAQDTLFELREELFQLQSENDRLRQELKSRDSWEAQKAGYQLQETSGGAVVYMYSGSPQHYACPSCFAKMTIQILQDRRVVAGVFDCPSCKAVYPVKAPQELNRPRPQRAKLDWDVFNYDRLQ
jgi:hypothetical protein